MPQPVFILQVGQDALQLPLVIHGQASWDLLAARGLSVRDGAGVAQQVLVLIPVAAGGGNTAVRNVRVGIAGPLGLERGGFVREFPTAAPGGGAQRWLQQPGELGVPRSLRLQGLGGKAGMLWVGGDGATGTWLHRSRGRRQNSQAIVGGQAVAEEGTVLVFHLRKPGGNRTGLRHVQRHLERLLSAP